MATVFMKWLETTPGDYDRGIQLLTLGRLTPLKERIATQYVGPGDRVLEIGCGTGTLVLMMAQRGATVVGIDASPRMLAEARRKVDEAGLTESIELHEIDVSELADRFSPASFDLIVSTLVFSEFAAELKRYALAEASRLLRPGGRLLIADEMIPQGLMARLLFYAVRLPLVVITWLLTRTTTRALSRFPTLLTEVGFTFEVAASHLGGSLQLINASPAAQQEKAPARPQSKIDTCCLPCAIESAVTTVTKEEEAPALIPSPLPEAVPQLRHQVTVKTLLLDLISLLNRFIPPYPKLVTGLYRVGSPHRSSPVLVTGNYELTVRRLVHELDGQVDCWLVVANSRGINVWCAAGGGHFTTEDVISAIKTSGVGELVDHHALILPQLCANGVDGWRIRQETKWGVHWGPVRAHDVPAYLAAGRMKTDTMRHVTFPLRNRLEMTIISTIFFGVLLAIPFAILWPHLLWLTLSALAIQALVFGLLLPWIPGRDGMIKGVFLAAATVLGVALWGQLAGDWPLIKYFNRSLGLGFLAYFIAGEFQGMSPLMRGEANWDVELGVGLLTLLAYGVGRLLIGT
jgi:ubiquinone/menaquinone biosynthesis C-methylase UbiE